MTFECLRHSCKRIHLSAFDINLNAVNSCKLLALHIRINRYQGDVCTGFCIEPWMCKRGSNANIMEVGRKVERDGTPMPVADCNTVDDDC